MVFVGGLVFASSTSLLLDCLNEFEKEFGNSGKPFWRLFAIKDDLKSPRFGVTVWQIIHDLSAKWLKEG